MRYAFALAGLLLLLPAPSVLAVCPAGSQSCSTTYRVDQTFFGSGGTDQNACSGSYCAKQTAGELGVGNTCGTSYCATAGFNTTDDPFLEFVVTGNNIDLGYLDTASTKTANGTFSVRAWESGGYSVTTESNPPTNTGPAGQYLTAMSGQNSSIPGSEQFGINLVANLTTAPCNAPANFGADPQQIPDATFSFGQVDSSYDDCGQFKYAKGDRVAYATKSTSVTTYTISYIFNINDATPSGSYVFNHILVATGAY